VTHDVEKIAAGLSEAQREALTGIHPGFCVGDRFRLDEGEHHAPYTALVKLGFLDRLRIGGHYTTYALTESGLRLRAHLIQEQGQ
jgi:hypothetical protein